jgi:hypothetical protein
MAIARPTAGRRGRRIATRLVRPIGVRRGKAMASSRLAAGRRGRKIVMAPVRPIGVRHGGKRLVARIRPGHRDGRMKIGNRSVTTIRKCSHC